MGACLPPHQYSLVWSLNGPLECVRQEEIPECSAKEKNLLISKKRKLKVAKGQETRRQERHSRNPHSHVGLQAPEMETKHPKANDETRMEMNLRKGRPKTRLPVDNPTPTS